MEKLIEYYYGTAQEVYRVQLELTLDRNPSNIIWKILLPLALLVLSMWAIFWMGKDSLGDRLNISFIGILSVIAYQFLIAGDTPRIDYFTFVDSFLLISFAILFTTILESIWVHWLIEHKKVRSAYFVDIFFRTFFPAGYLLLLYIAYCTYT